MITKKRLKNIKENVYMRSEIAKISGLGIDTSLREELELIEEIDRLNNIIDNARKYIENNQSGCENENAHFHLNFDGDIWKLYEMLRRF